MPALQLEQQICDWIEEPCEEIDLTSYKNTPMVITASVLEGSTKDMLHAEPLRKRYSAFWRIQYKGNPEQYIWDLADAVRAKVAREAIESYESERLIKEINEVYDEEMEREDKEFARRTKGYYRRLLSTED